MKTLFTAFIFLMAGAGHASIAQTTSFTINGRVTSFEESLALEGVTIHVKGSGNYTGTLPDGRFSLDITDESKILVLELKEYETAEVPIDGKKELDIVLKRSEGHAYLNRTPANASYSPAGHTDLADRIFLKRNKLM